VGRIPGCGRGTRIAVRDNLAGTRFQYDLPSLRAVPDAGNIEYIMGIIWHSRRISIEPHQYSDGVELLFVNGVQAIDKSKATGDRGGRALKRI